MKGPEPSASAFSFVDSNLPSDANSAADGAGGGGRSIVASSAAASVTFGFDKSVLTRKDKDQLDQLATPLNTTKGYILEVTGGTDSVGSAEYNYDLSQRRAEAVVQYLASKYNVPAHKFYLIGIGKDKEVASNKTAAGRAQNRRVDIQMLSNMQPGNATVSEVQSH